ncbi:PRC-barrel domain-containing protein [Enterovirga sp.]|uniref:PRC-barrel domain-containing protein n=1 Tax=Enterovirga sp. TaxID=2026350 RepID=UPI002B59CBF3|nr:PRC-barrel domain-containing protein [Enterovirga sp.]HMO28973.1 PRC-barrel domain-containing protein [Enterovirga sp.]
MNRPTLTTLLLASCLAAGSASAQTTAPSSPAPGMTPAERTVPSERFVKMQGMDEFKASKFVGLAVYGSEGEKIGDVSEILLDARGNAKAVVIGVGGFLGIGQKNVALPWSAVTWSNEAAPSRTAGADRPSTTGSTTRPANPMGTGPAGMPPTRGPAEQAAYNGYPDHGVVRLSKAELKEAPAFRYVADTGSTSR